MPRCALPEKLDEPEEWKGTDWDNWFQRPLLKIKHWFAFGPRCPQGLTFALIFFPFVFFFPVKILLGMALPIFQSLWWYLVPILPIPVLKKWRETPIVLFAIRGPGAWRWEHSDGSHPDFGSDLKMLIWKETDSFYLSVIQYWCKWSFVLEWPLSIRFHWYINEQYKKPFGERPTDAKVVFFRHWARRDSDVVYWFDTFYFGLEFN